MTLGGVSSQTYTTRVQEDMYILYNLYIVYIMYIMYTKNMSMIDINRTTRITTWWKYRNLFERVIRRKTIYYHDTSENVVVGCQIRRNGLMYVVHFKRHGKLV